LEEIHKQNCCFASNMNRLFRLAVFVKEKGSGDDQSLKLRWMKLEAFLTFPLEEEGLDGALFNKTKRKHILREVTDLLKLKFPETWIGMSRPPRSPELTSLYSSLGCPSRLLFTCYHWQALAGRMTAEVATATLDFRNNVQTKYEYR
jgi:hypothetical protein